MDRAVIRERTLVGEREAELLAWSDITVEHAAVTGRGVCRRILVGPRDGRARTDRDWVGIVRGRRQRPCAGDDSYRGAGVVVVVAVRRRGRRRVAAAA